jgi:hypothetical protein
MQIGPFNMKLLLTRRIVESLNKQIHGSEYYLYHNWCNCLIIGIIAGKFIFNKNTAKKVEEAELQSQTILKEAELRAETIRKEKELEAKEKFVQLKQLMTRKHWSGTGKQTMLRIVSVKKNNPLTKKK